MMVGMDLWRQLRGLLLVLSIGCVLSVVAAGISAPAAGGGHGTYLPGAMLLSPAFMISSFREDTNLAAPSVLVPALTLYAVYGLVFAVGRKWNLRKSALALVMTFHYAALAVTLYNAEFDFRYWIVYYASLLYGSALLTYWVLVHVLAFQFALSKPPYRPRLSLWVIALLAVVLTINAVLYNTVDVRG